MTNTVQQALEFAQREAASGTTRWRGMCQMFSRTAYGIGPGNGSAYLQWLALPPDERHAGGSPADAPLGAPLFFKGTGQHGHIAIKKRDQDGAVAVWGNDDFRHSGRIVPTLVSEITGVWRQGYLGWGESINGVALPLAVRQPKPVLTRYAGLLNAIPHLEGALETAVRQKDWADAKLIRRQLRITRKLADRLRREA